MAERTLELAQEAPGTALVVSSPEMRERPGEVETETVAIQRRRRIDFLSGHVEVESGDDELRERKLLRGRGRSRL